MAFMDTKITGIVMPQTGSIVDVRGQYQDGTKFYLEAIANKRSCQDINNGSEFTWFLRFFSFYYWRKYTYNGIRLKLHSVEKKWALYVDNQNSFNVTVAVLHQAGKNQEIFGDGVPKIGDVVEMNTPALDQNGYHAGTKNDEFRIKGRLMVERDCKEVLLCTDEPIEGFWRDKSVRFFELYSSGKSPSRQWVIYTEYDNPQYQQNQIQTQFNIIKQYNSSNLD